MYLSGSLIFSNVTPVIFNIAFHDNPGALKNFPVYVAEITPYLNTFHAMSDQQILCSSLENQM